MPIERRRVSLFEGEVRLAVESYRRATPEVLPAGPLQQVSITDVPGGAPAMTVSVLMRYGSVEQLIEVRLNDDHVLALVVRFCVENNIPLPRTAKKTVVLQDGMLTLVFDFDRGSLAPA